MVNGFLVKCKSCGLRTHFTTDGVQKKGTDDVSTFIKNHVAICPGKPSKQAETPA